jgi:cytidine deaminase
VTDEDLIEYAIKAQQNAYAPYSKFKVGAALLGSDGHVYTGANIENRSYGLTICAERCAVSTAVASGCKEFAKLAVYTSCSPPATPCGACRQVLYEFASDLQIICANDKNEINRFTLSKLFPDGFPYKGE